MRTYNLNQTVNTEREWISNAPASDKQIWFAKKLMVENEIEFVCNKTGKTICIDNASKTTASDIIDFILNKKFENVETVATEETVAELSNEVAQIVEIVEIGRISNSIIAKVTKLVKQCDMVELSDNITIDELKKFTGLKTSRSAIIKSFINIQKDIEESERIDAQFEKALLNKKEAKTEEATGKFIF